MNTTRTPPLLPAPPHTAAPAREPASPVAPPNGQTPPDSSLPTRIHRPSTIAVIAATCLLVAVLAAFFVLGWLPHRDAAALIRADAADHASDIPTVTVAVPTVSPASTDLVLPCNIEGLRETALYPRAAGYLAKLNVDIGDHVSAGQLLAEISAPDLDADLAHSQAALEQARAAVLKAQTDLDLARRTLARYDDVQRTGAAITTQELDERRSAAASAQGTLTLANANVLVADAEVRRLSVLQSFEKVTAPFAGTITARNYDLGALLAATSSSSRPLFALAQTDTLRVFVNVPQVDATFIADGQPASLTVRNYPARTFTGTVTRSTASIDPQTRTLRFELDFPNPRGELVPGMYGEAHLGLSQPHPALIIPVSAMLFNAAGSQVALVRNGQVHLQNISIGRDLGTQLEIVDGLTPADQIIVNPDLRIAEGARVQTLPIAGKPLAQADRRAPASDAHTP